MVDIQFLTGLGRAEVDAWCGDTAMYNTRVYYIAPFCTWYVIIDIKAYSSSSVGPRRRKAWTQSEAAVTIAIRAHLAFP